MSENTLAETDMATDAASTTTAENQVAKTYSQKEVDDMMARMKTSLKSKLLKPYEELGDPDELRQLKADAESKRQSEQLKRGEFEKTLQELAQKKDAEISKRDTIIKEYKVNSPLLSAAAKHRAVNAEQVKSLLSTSVRLNADGDVEVVGDGGVVRYRDDGQPLAVEDLVREFLDSNPHFVSASLTTANTRSNVSQGSQEKIDVSKLDMKNPEHRKVYAQYRKAAGIA